MINKIVEFFNLNVDSQWHIVPITEKENRFILSETIKENIRRAREVNALCKDLPIEFQVKVLDNVSEHLHYVKEKYARFKLDKALHPPMVEAVPPSNVDIK